MFKERINSVFDVLGVNTKEFAEFSECDRSNISHIKSGRRILKKNGKAVKRLVENIRLYAEKNGRVEVLCKAMEIPPVYGRELETKVGEWLFETYSSESANQKRKIKDKKNNLEFAKKFNSCMGLAGISNIKLAQIISVDPSLISRYRSGQRVPSDNKIAKVLSVTLLKYIYIQNNAEKLCSLMGTELSMFDNPDSVREYFIGWLCDFKGKTNMAVEKLLTGIDRMLPVSPEENTDIVPFYKAADESILADRADKYIGIDGLHRAVIRFLGNAIKNSYDELWLYSDQNMDWMTTDKEFFLKWFSLMYEALKSGVKINIIHNVDRGIEEMLAAIKSWLPLYLSGNIKSFYSTKPNGVRFSHTVFIAPGNAAIFGCSPVEFEDRAEYVYSTEPSGVAFYEEFYKGIMEYSRELIKVLPHENVDDISYISGVSDVHIIRNRISLGSAPKSLIDKIAERDIKDVDVRERFLAEWQRKSKVYLAKAGRGNICEYISLPENADIYLESDNVDIRYNAEYLSEHIEHVLKLSETEKNYRLAILPYMLLENSRLIMSDKSVIVRHMSEPSVDLTLNHPLMCAAFSVYAEDLIKQYAVSRRNMDVYLKRYS